MQFIDNYLEGMKNPSHVKYPHPLYENASKETFGILVYQEQIMQVVQDMAGFSLGEADILRRGVAKKEDEYIAMMEKKFSERCVNNGVPEETAKEVYAMIKKFAEYGFNKSHSAAYARISYETAYLKAHYPECFMAANLTVNADNKEKLLTSLVETRNMGITILPPDIEKSSASFTVEAYKDKEASQNLKGIRFGLNGIESIGVDVASSIQHQNVHTLYDFVDSHQEIRKNQIEKLIEAGAFDKFGSRKDMIEILPKMREFLKYKHSFHNTYGKCLLDKVIGEDFYDGFEYSLMDKMVKEKNAINISLSGHMLDYIRPIKESYQNFERLPHLLEKNDREEVIILANLREFKVITTKKSNKPMAFVTLEDEYMDIEGIIFPKVYEEIDYLLSENTPFLITGIMSVENAGEQDEKRSIIINSVERVLNKDLRVFVPSAVLNNKAVISKLKECNGICAILTIDDKKLVHKTDLYVDIGKAIDILNSYHIPHVSNTQL